MAHGSSNRGMSLHFLQGLPLLSLHVSGRIVHASAFMGVCESSDITARSLLSALNSELTQDVVFFLNFILVRIFEKI